MNLFRALLAALALTFASASFASPAPAFAQHDLEENVEATDFEDAHAALHGEHEHITFSQILADKQFLASMITFLVLVVLFYVLAGKKVGAYLQSRRRDIEENLAEAQRKKAEAEAVRAEYADRLERMGDELERIKTEMVAAGEAERDRIIADAEQRAAAMRRDTQFQIEQKFKQLRSDLSEETVQAAIAAAHTLLAEQATMSDQTRLAEDYLTRVAAAASDEVQA